MRGKLYVSLDIDVIKTKQTNQTKNPKSTNQQAGGIKKYALQGTTSLPDLCQYDLSSASVTIVRSPL